MKNLSGNEGAQPKRKAAARKRNPTKQEREETARFKGIWEKFKFEKRVTQGWMAEQLNLSGQSAFSAYLNAEITPINLDIIWKFSQVTGCNPASIRPSLAAHPWLLNDERRRMLGKLERLDDDALELAFAMLERFNPP